ncbi:hypothetical protein B0H17DRAFT_357826 [Mycena rosella]|uniref:Uncharacterized protein n=1 Tax=Mycena rosella TaxID=1033263 RepID=A0AAD7G1R1_MYCRO|nr:hypothetical protein B0H17DRAFT_357826 [Mycena rosella]
MRGPACAGGSRWAFAAALGPRSRPALGAPSSWPVRGAAVREKVRGLLLALAPLVRDAAKTQPECETRPALPALPRCRARPRSPIPRSPSTGVAAAHGPDLRDRSRFIGACPLLSRSSGLTYRGPARTTRRTPRAPWLVCARSRTHPAWRRLVIRLGCACPSRRALPRVAAQLQREQTPDARTAFGTHPGIETDSRCRRAA